MQRAEAFRFRPWVRRAGASILVVALLCSLAIAFLVLSGIRRYGWAEEPFVWVYVGVLWIGGGKVFLGTYRPIAELSERDIVLRPLHMLGSRKIRWEEIVGTQQMLRGDRLIVYYQSAKGMRFIALNLNLVRGRREFLERLDQRLGAAGLTEKLVDESRYMRRRGADEIVKIDG